MKQPHTVINLWPFIHKKNNVKQKIDSAEFFDLTDAFFVGLLRLHFNSDPANKRL